MIRTLQLAACYVVGQVPTCLLRRTLYAKIKMPRLALRRTKRYWRPVLVKKNPVTMEQI
jgi:hypothetical protein